MRSELKNRPERWKRRNNESGRAAAYFTLRSYFRFMLGLQGLGLQRAVAGAEHAFMVRE
jgi:hypothetical protein